MTHNYEQLLRFKFEKRAKLQYDTFAIADELVI